MRKKKRKSGKLEDVLPLLREGKKIHRKGWVDKQRFISIRKDSDPNIRFSRMDIIADDWEEYLSKEDKQRLYGISVDDGED